MTCDEFRALPALDAMTVAERVAMAAHALACAGCEKDLLDAYNRAAPLSAERVREIVAMAIRDAADTEARPPQARSTP